MPEAAIGADVMGGISGRDGGEFAETRAFIEMLPFTYLPHLSHSSGLELWRRNVRIQVEPPPPPSDCLEAAPRSMPIDGGRSLHLIRTFRRQSSRRSE